MKVKPEHGEIASDIAQQIVVRLKNMHLLTPNHMKLCIEERPLVALAKRDEIIIRRCLEVVEKMCGNPAMPEDMPHVYDLLEAIEKVGDEDYKEN